MALEGQILLKSEVIAIQLPVILNVLYLLAQPNSYILVSGQSLACLLEIKSVIVLVPSALCAVGPVESSVRHKSLPRVGYHQ